MSLPPAPRACRRRARAWSCSTAGACAEPGPGNAVSLARTPVFDELWARLSAHDADRLRARGGPARRADGQQRGRAPEPRRRRGRAPGPGAHRRRDRRRLARRSNEVLRAAFAGRRARAPDRPRLRRRRALLAGAPARADRARRATLAASRIWSCTRSPTGATRCRTRAPATCAELDATRGRARRLGRGALLGDGPRPALGPHPARLRHARARPRAAPRRAAASRRCATPTSAARPTSSSSRRSSASEARDPARRQRDRVQLPARPHARDRRARWPSRASAERRAEELPGWSGRGGAPPVARYTTLTEYEEGWPYPVAFAPERPATTLAGGARAARARAAARGRDREVPARDVLLQRRRGGAAGRRAARAGAPRRATCRPTTTSRR